MSIIREETIIQAPVSIAYGVAAQVTDYPKFLPDVKSVRVTGDIVRMSVQLGPVEVTWKSRATFVPDKTITVNLVDGPFSQMQVQWIFAPVDQGTHVVYSMKFKLDLPILGLETIVSTALRQNARRSVTAFKKRALEIHRTNGHQIAGLSS